MAQISNSSSFEKALNALTKYLQTAVKANEIISIPETIEKPFRSASRPSDSSLLRPLLKLFEGKPQYHVLKLAANSYCGIVSIVLHFPYSTTQEKLLHVFMTAVHTYREAGAAVRILNQCGVSNITPDQISATVQAICDRLLHTLLRKLPGERVEKRLRWTTTRFLSILLRDSASACTRLISYPECKHLSVLLRDMDDYVTRILVANLMRELIHHGAKPSTFWPNETVDKVILSFPAASCSSTAWFTDLRRFFADLDSTIALNAGRQCMFSIDHLVYKKGSRDQSVLNAVAVISEDLIFVVLDDEHTFRISSVPVLDQSNMQVSHQADPTKKSTISVLYANDTGFELRDGTKSALDSVFLSFEDASEAATAYGMLSKQQEDLSILIKRQEMEGNFASVMISTPKRSFALVNLWSPENQVEDTTLPSSEARQTGSDMQEMSPLQHRSQQLSQGPHAISDGDRKLETQPSDSETASETSFLEAAQKGQGFTERLQASQEEAAKGLSSSAFNTRVDDVVARKVSLKLGSKSATPLPRVGKVGATQFAPRLPQVKSRSSRLPSTVRSASSAKPSKNGQAVNLRQTSTLSGIVSITPVASPSHANQAAELRDSRAKPGGLTKVVVTASKNTGRVPGGPMARLAGSQTQNKQQTSKPESQASFGLKRKIPSLESSKHKKSDTDDWDEDIHDENAFELPRDLTDDERPAKKARKGKQSAAKASTQESSAWAAKGKITKDIKVSIGKPRKTRKNAAAVSKPTVASTRQRRGFPKSTTYVEESPSEEDIASGSASAELLAESSLAPEPSKPRSPLKSKLSKKRDIATVSDSQAVVPSKVETTDRQKEVERFKSKAARTPTKNSFTKTDNVVSQSSNALRRPGSSTDITSPDNGEFLGIELNGHGPIIGKDTAEDSYPMDDASRILAAAAAKRSFGNALETQLQDMAWDSEVDKENMPTAPLTPFGNKKQFVANVNAARTSTPGKGQVSQIQKFPDARALGNDQSHRHTKDSELGGLPAVSVSRSKLSSGKGPSQCLSNSVTGAALYGIEASGTYEATITESNDQQIPTLPLLQPEPRATARVKFQTVMMLMKAQGVLSDDSEQPAVAEPRPSLPLVLTKQAKNGADDPAGNVSRGVTPQEEDGPVASITKNQRMAVESEQYNLKSHRATGTKSAHVAPNNISELKISKTPYISPDVGTDQKARTAPNKSVQTGHVEARAALKINELQTPQRETMQPEEPLTSDKIAKKPTIVAFGTNGPVNQGVQNRAINRSTQALATAAAETVKYYGSKEQALRSTDLDTPTRGPPEERESGILISVDDEAGMDDFGMVEAKDTTYPCVEGKVKPGREEVNYNNSAAPEAVVAKKDMDATNMTAAEIVDEPALNQAHSEEYSSDMSSSVETEDAPEEELSEYEEGLHSDDLAARGDSQESSSDGGFDKLAAPETPQLNDSTQPLVRSTAKSMHQTEPRSRQSNALGLVVKRLYPNAAEKISTQQFRRSQQEGTGTACPNLGAINNDSEKEQRSEPAKSRRRLLDDRAAMPPPKVTKRRNLPENHDFKSVAVESSERFSSPHQAINSVTERRLSSSVVRSVQAREHSGLEQPVERLAAAPVRVKRQRQLQQDLEPTLPAGTPVPFHSMLTESIAQTEKAGETYAQRKTGSYLSGETADITLVNRTPASSLMPQRRTASTSRQNREMTETTEEFPSPSSRMGQMHDRRLWKAWLRRPRGDLFEDVMQIANDVLFRLGEEEDAVRAKASEYQRGGSALLDEITVVWNDRIIHESKQTTISVNEARTRLMDTIQGFGKDQKGHVVEWRRIRRNETVAKTSDTRGKDLMDGLEALRDLVDT